MTTLFHPDDWAILAPNTDGGLGRMGEDMKRTLGLRKRLVPSTAISDRKSLETTDHVMDVESSITDLKEALAGLEGVIAFEKFWHPQLLLACREMGIKTVCVPMWEWFRGCSPAWRNCDFFICPTEICLRIVRHYGFLNSVHAPWVLDLSRFPARHVCGPARHFIHNAGEVDPDDRKGTKDAIAAFRRVENPDLRLTVRTQRVKIDTGGDPRISSWVGTLPDPAQLYAEGDVFIQPSKLEGVGFMVLEAVATGLPVIAVNSPPLNDWVRQPEMLARPSFFSYPAYSSSWIEQSHLRPVNIPDLARRIAWAAGHDMTAISTQNRAWAESTFAPEKLRRIWTELLEKVLSLPPQPPVKGDPDPPLPCFTLASRFRLRVREGTGLQLPFFKPPLSGIN